MSKLQELIRELCPDGVEYKKLRDICKLNRGTRVVRNDLSKDGEFEVYQNSLTPLGYYDKSNYPAYTTFIISAGAAGEIGFTEKPIWAADDCLCLTCPDNISSKYVYYCLLNNRLFLSSKVRKASVPRLARTAVEQFEIPVPPLPVQEEIVRILDHFTNLAAELQAELQARKEQYEYYRNKLLTFGKNAERIEWKRLEDVLHSIRTGLNPRKFFKLNTPDATSYYVTIREFNGGNLTFTDSTDRINETARILCNNRSNLEYNDVLFSGTGTIGETYVIDNIPSNWNIKEGVYSLKPKIHIILPKYLKYILSQSDIKASYLKLAEGGTVKSISMRKLGNFPIPVPSLSEQQRIVSILDKFEALVNDLSEGLPAEIAAVQEQYEYYRNKLLSFPKLAVA